MPFGNDKDKDGSSKSGKSLKQALSIAMSLKKKAQEKSHGGKCYACGGQINPKLQESHMAQGGMAGSWKEEENLEHTPDWDGFKRSEIESAPDTYDVEPERYAEGGGVDEAGPMALEHSGDPDGDEDDLVHSPEEYGETGFGAGDNQKDENEDSKRSKFIRAYLVNRKMRSRA